MTNPKEGIGERVSEIMRVVHDLESWRAVEKNFGSRKLIDDAAKRLREIDEQHRRQSQGAGEWRPIDTAPRDSRRILVGYFNHEGEWRAHEAWWRIPYESAPKERGWWCYDRDGTLLSADVHKSPEGRRLGATHWQPLPGPPALSHPQPSQGECENTTAHSPQ